MNHKQQQEFETWLVEQITLKRTELGAASPSGQEAIREVLYWLGEVHWKFLGLGQEPPHAAEPAAKHAHVPHAAEPAPKHGHFSHSTPKTKSSH
jgi:hypothetical protein